MESSGIPIETLFGTAPLTNTGQTNTPLQHTDPPGPPFEQIQGQIWTTHLSNSYIIEDYDFDMSSNTPDSVPVRIVKEMDRYALPVCIRVVHAAN